MCLGYNLAMFETVLNMNTPLLFYSDWVLLVVRIIIGVILIYYGWPKVKDLKKNAEDFVEMGFKPGWFWGTLIALLEFFGGILMIIGVLVPLVAALFGIEMIVGMIWKITKVKKPFTDWSYDLLLLALMLLLLITGTGSYVI